MNQVIHFGPHIVTRQVFYRTSLSFAVVNIRPLLPGHILICPHRVVPHMSQLTSSEISDLFLTVQKLQKTLKRIYNAAGFNVAVQDGKAAGQSVAHVHCHVIPRKEGDMDSKGGGDKLYEMLEGEEGDLESHFKSKDVSGERKVGDWAKDEERKDRSEEEMNQEAEMLKREIEKDENGDV